MEQVFWLIPGEIAGRCGPDKEPWDPEQLAQCGIGAIISVNDGALVHEQDLRQAGIEYACIPLSPNAPPREGDLQHCLEALPLALAFVVEMRARNKTVLIHCSSGKDRTGLLMCYYLCQCKAFRPRAAMEALWRVRPIGLSATDYEAFVEKLLIQTTADQAPK